MHDTYVRPYLERCSEAVRGLVELAVQVEQYTQSALNVRVDPFTGIHPRGLKVQVLHLVVHLPGKIDTLREKFVCRNKFQNPIVII